MTSDKNLLLRAAWITLIIALVGVGVLYAVIEVADAEKPGLFDIDWSNQDDAIEETVHADESSHPGTTGNDRERNAAASVDFAAYTRDIAYIDQVFPVISSWQLENIQPYFASETRQKSEHDPDFRDVLAVLSNELGTLKSWEHPMPDSLLTATPIQAASMISTLAEYRFMALYEQGLAQVNVVLENMEGRNALYAFQIEVVN